jgi:hypothetical protein
MISKNRPATNRRFLHVQIALEPNGGPITLDLTGPPGTREFLTDFFDQR